MPQRTRRMLQLLTAARQPRGNDYALLPQSVAMCQNQKTSLAGGTFQIGQHPSADASC
jgi:hypothetical protein